MRNHTKAEESSTAASSQERNTATSAPALLPLTNYTLSAVCPACDSDTMRLACKVRCTRCGFMWDCSEL